MPPAPHILTYAQTLGPGGVERAQLRLARGWLQAGRRVTLVVGEPRGPLRTRLPEGLELVTLGSSDFLALRALPRLIRAIAPSILFCPGNHYTSMAGWTKLRLRSGCPPIVAKLSNAPARGDHGRMAALGHAAWLRAHAAFVDHLVAMTPATAAVGAEAMGLPAARVSVIPNPPALPVPGARAVTLPEGRILLGVGRLAPQKRWDRLVAALATLEDRAVRLVILGEGDERARLLAQAAALGVGERVHLPGEVEDPLPAMCAAAAVVLPSDFEGVPGVLREALSVGTPVVATDASAAVAEIVACPSLGTVVPRGDAAALARALTWWLAPGRARPAPVPQPGGDSVVRYLALFDALAARARAGRAAASAPAAATVSAPFRSGEAR